MATQFCSHGCALPGDEVRCEVHGTSDAVTPVPVRVVIYNDGSLVERVLAADEFLVVDEAEMNVIAPGEDLHIYMATATGVFVAGGTVLRGTPGTTNVLLLETLPCEGRAYGKGLVPWFFVAGAGRLFDVVMRGRIVKG